MDKEKIHLIIVDLRNDIKQAIIDLEEILSLISDQQRIDSFNETFCKNCKQPCGRSNAEILNCVIKKRHIQTDMDERSYDKPYTKEYLEQDLKKIIQDLKAKYEDIELIDKKNEKNN